MIKRILNSILIFLGWRTKVKEEITHTYIPIHNGDEWMSIELDIIRLINVYREGLGLNSLKVDANLQSEAELRNFEQLGRKKISHEGFPLVNERLVEKGLVSISEILGFGYASAAGVVRAWKRSEGHNRILIHPDNTLIGINVKLNKDGRKHYCGLTSKNKF